MRRVLLVSVALTLLTLATGPAAGAAPAARAAATSGARPPVWVQRETNWQSLAAGEADPGLCCWVLTSPRRAARLADSATSYLRSFPVPGRVFVVVLRGSFGSSAGAGGGADRLYLILRARDHGYLALGTTDARRLHLARLGHLHHYLPHLALDAGLWGHTMAEGGPFPGGPWPLPNVEVAVWQGASAPASGQPLTEVRSDEAGFFFLSLAPGTYTLRLDSGQDGWQAPSTVTVVAGEPVAVGVYTIRP